MIEALQGNLRVKGDAMSPATLIRDMNSVLITEYANYCKKGGRDSVMPQAAHYLLRRTQSIKILLPYCPQDSEDEGD